VSINAQIIARILSDCAAKNISFSAFVERIAREHYEKDNVEGKTEKELKKEFEDARIKQAAITSVLEERESASVKEAEELAQKELDSAKQLQRQAAEAALAKKYESWWRELDDDEKIALLDAGFKQAKGEGLSGVVAAKRKSSLIDEWWASGKWKEIVAKEK